MNHIAAERVAARHGESQSILQESLRHVKAVIGIPLRISRPEIDARTEHRLMDRQRAAFPQFDLDIHILGESPALGIDTLRFETVFHPRAAHRHRYR